jgi:ATP synthase protein I
MGVELVVATCLGGGLGWLADTKLGTLPWLTLLGVVFGIAAGIRNTLRLAGELEKAAKGEDGRQEDGP